MKQLTQENIQQLNIATGGGIVSEKTRIDTINHPVLVIGLGGTGTDALLRLKYQVSRRFKLPENPITKQKKHKPDNIDFLALETNDHEKKRYKGVTLDPHTEMVQLSNGAIGSILNNRSTMPEYIKTWLHPGLTITDGTKGASGNRQAGRLLLFEKINTTIEAIENKIRTLRANQENKLLVFILSGLSGGTGGGMFLDIAYIVRGLMEREYGAKGVDKVEIGGYLFTPDVNLAGNNMNIHTEEYIQRNGYAALKELDYWMNIEERPGDYFRQQYGTRLSVNSGLAPFNLCHLVSASNTEGVLLKGAYDYCMNVTAENIVNFLALEEKESGQEFAVQDYYSNLTSNISTMKTSLPDTMPHGANFVYNIIGASAAVLPTEELSAYIAHGLFREMAPMFDAMPEYHQLAEFTQATGLDTPQMVGKLMEGLPPIKLDYTATDYYSHQNVIKTNRVSIDEKLTEQYNTAKRELTKATKAIKESGIAAIEAALQGNFQDPTKGPLYTARLIFSNINPCLVPRLTTYGETLTQKIHQMAETIDALDIAAETKYTEAQKALFITKESKKNAYIAAKIALYQSRLERDVLLALVDVYKGMVSALEESNHKTYAPYVDILQALRDTLANNMAPISQPTSTNENKAYDWHVVHVSDIVPEVDCVIAHIGATPLIKDLAKMLLAEKDKFLNLGQLNIASAVSEFIFHHMGGVISRTMGDFLAMKYGQDRMIEDIIETDIAPRLYRDAKPVFNLDNTAGMLNFPSYGMVSVPYNAPEILRGIESYKAHALSSHPFNMRKSTITDRIFWLNTQNGVPLFAYSALRVQEALYERTITTREGVGRHLVMTEAESWMNLPSPIPQALWGDTYQNPRQKELNTTARTIFQTAIENGIIKEVGGRYVCIHTKSPDLGQYPLDAKTPIETLHKALSTLQEAAHQETGRTVIFTTTNQAEAEAHFIRNIPAIHQTREENIKHSKTAGKIAHIQSLLAAVEAEKATIEAFLRTIVCEAIVKRGAHYIFEKSLEEDPWPPFVNLIDQADYPEYTIYQSYKALPPERKEALKERALHNQSNWPEGKLLVSLKKWQGKIALGKSQLDTTSDTLTDGANIYAFYRNALLRLNAQVNAVM